MWLMPVEGVMQRVEVLGFDAALADGDAMALEGHLRVRVADGAEQRVPLSSVLSLHGAVPRRAGSTEVHLVGGERLHGEVAAGDDAGETFGFVSPTFGRLAVPIDRLEVLVFRERAGDARPAEFRIPADAEVDEALFRRAAKVGFSRVLGGIQRFRAESVLFAAGEGDRARAAEPYRYDDLVAIALRSGIARESAPSAMLLTRSGDFVGAELRGWERGAFRFAIEGASQEIRLPVEEIAALTQFGPGRRYLSDLEPATVEERAFFDEHGVLMPHVMDRSVTGEELVVGEVAFGKGIGVHSRSVLRWRVPDGARSLRALVGMDRSVASLGLRAGVRVVVRVGERVAFERDELFVVDGAVDVGRIELTPGEILTLEVDFGPGLDFGDRVAWLGAVLLD